jgi:hypothetical protein
MSARMWIATCALATTLGCAGGMKGLSPLAPSHLDGAPLVLIELVSGGVIDWQIDRDEAIVGRLEECLPKALAPICPGICEVVEADGEELEPHVVLTVKTTYSASAHFMYGFRLDVVFTMADRTGTVPLASYAFAYEPHTKVMADEGDPQDEVLTFDSVLTADRLCDEIGMHADEIASKAGDG